MPLLRPWSSFAAAGFAHIYTFVMPLYSMCTFHFIHGPPKKFVHKPFRELTKEQSLCKGLTLAEGLHMRRQCRCSPSFEYLSPAIFRRFSRAMYSYCMHRNLSSSPNSVLLIMVLVPPHIAFMQQAVSSE